MSDHGVGRIDADVVAAAGQLRRRGAEELVLVGSSMGATAVPAAAARIRPRRDPGHVPPGSRGRQAAPGRPARPRRPMLAYRDDGPKVTAAVRRFILTRSPPAA
jgi:hypothetical protein